MNSLNLFMPCAAGVEGYEICPEAVIHAELRAARLAGAKLISQGCSPYPPLLHEIEDQPSL